MITTDGIQIDDHLEATFTNRMAKDAIDVLENEIND